MYIYHKQCEIMQKKSMKQLKRSTSLISHWFPVEMVHNGPKLCKRKRCFLCCKNFQEVSRYALWKLTSCRFRKCDGFYAIIFITLFLNCIIIVFFSFTVINLLSYFSVSGILYFNSSWCDTFQMPMCWKVIWYCWTVLHVSWPYKCIEMQIFLRQSWEIHWHGLRLM